MGLQSPLSRPDASLASAIDTPLPQPPERTQLMLDFAASWVEVPNDPNEHHYKRYLGESLTSWHQRLGLTVKA